MPQCCQNLVKPLPSRHLEKKPPCTQLKHNYPTHKLKKITYPQRSYANHVPIPKLSKLPSHYNTSKSSYHPQTQQATIPIPKLCKPASYTKTQQITILRLCKASSHSENHHSKPKLRKSPSHIKAQKTTILYKHSVKPCRSIIPYPISENDHLTPNV